MKSIYSKIVRKIISEGRYVYHTKDYCYLFIQILPYLILFFIFIVMSFLPRKYVISLCLAFKKKLIYLYHIYYYLKMSSQFNFSIGNFYLFLTNNIHN